MSNGIIAPGNRYRFAKPGFMGTRPIVEVIEFNQQDKQVRYRYIDWPEGEMSRKVENFLGIYEDRVA